LRIDIFEISIKSRFLGRQKISGTLVDRSLKNKGKKTLIDGFSFKKQVFYSNKYTTGGGGGDIGCLRHKIDTVGGMRGDVHIKYSPFLATGVQKCLNLKADLR
jgi:hypothetical protein